MNIINSVVGNQSNVSWAKIDRKHVRFTLLWWLQSWIHMVDGVQVIYESRGAGLVIIILQD